MLEHAKEWYVKTDDGKAYGPADLPTLVKWAREGRIEPTSFVSSDRVKWAPAPLVPELDMKWIVETELGRLFGPFHHDVVSRLINEKLVPPTARIFRLYDGEQETGAVAVVETKPVAPPTVLTKKKSIFSGVDVRKLAALELAARREMEAARKRGIDLSIFGSKRK